MEELENSIYDKYRGKCKLCRYSTKHGCHRKLSVHCFDCKYNVDNEYTGSDCFEKVLEGDEKKIDCHRCAYRVRNDDIERCSNENKSLSAKNANGDNLMPLCEDANRGKNCSHFKSKRKVEIIAGVLYAVAFGIIVCIIAAIAIAELISFKGVFMFYD